MGYLYRPMFKGRERKDGPRCDHPRHGRVDTCPACGSRFAKIWWAKYYINGRLIRECTETEKETEARRFLKEREGRAVSGQPVLPRADRITYQEVAGDLRRHYEATGARGRIEYETRLKHLDDFFAGWRVANIGPAEVMAYVEKRQAARAANGTINRELGVLSRMLRLAYENRKLMRLPVLRKLKEAPPRQGFFEPQQYKAVHRHLPPDLQAALAIAYVFGWRTQSEVLRLERRHVDLDAGTLRLDPGIAKNDEGRLVYLPPDLKAQIAAQARRVRDLERRTGRVIPYLFPHLKGPHMGERRRDYRKAWAEACKKAGVPGMLKHDLRRTAVRDMVRRGVPERVGMMIAGHKTRSVFDRYNIGSEGDLRDAARRLAGKAAGKAVQFAIDADGVTVQNSYERPGSSTGRASAF